MENLPQGYDSNKDIGFTRSAAGPGTNVGAVAIEQERAIAEAQGQLILAKRFPRDLTAAHAELMIACKSKAFAEVAFYSVPNRGTGPSIRFAEEVARVFGNFQYGHRELSRIEGKSEVEVFAWDMQNNNRSTRQITVMHIVDTKYGPKPCRDQADVDNKIANVASKQMRGRILALLPKWLVAEAIEECKKTITGTNDEPISTRVRKMTQAFAGYGVTIDHLERYLGCKLDEVLIDQLVDMIGIYNAISKEGIKPSEYFESAKAAEQVTVNSAAVNNLNEKFANHANDNKAPDEGADQPSEKKPEETPAPRARRARATTTPKEEKPKEEPKQEADSAGTGEVEPENEPDPMPEPTATTSAPAKDLF